MEAAIKNLTIEQKIDLAEELWEEIEKERKSGLTQSQLELLNARWKSHLENPSAGISLEEFVEKYR